MEAGHWITGGGVQTEIGDKPHILAGLMAAGPRIVVDR